MDCGGAQDEDDQYLLRKKKSFEFQIEVSSL